MGSERSESYLDLSSSCRSPPWRGSVSSPCLASHLDAQIRVISERKRLLTSIGSFEPLLLIAPENVLAFVQVVLNFTHFLINLSPSKNLIPSSLAPISR